jgi:hypothetical protein
MTRVFDNIVFLMVDDNVSLYEFATNVWVIAAFEHKQHPDVFVIRPFENIRIFALHGHDTCKHDFYVAVLCLVTLFRNNDFVIAVIDDILPLRYGRFSNWNESATKARIV